jgi:hypothetical protein
MKKLMSSLLALAILNLMFVSCEQQEKDNPPELPPYESMFTDFSQFKVNEANKSVPVTDLKSTEEGTMINYGFSALEVGFFNIVLGVTLVIPVASFAAAFNHKPVFLGDATWQWSYDVSGFAKTYKARLVGQVRSDDILWEMYLAVEGIGGHPEFLWFHGTSDLDGHGGQWILNHSYEFQEPVLQIDWKSDGVEVGEIKYTYVRALNNNREVEKGNGNYVEVGKLAGDLDAYYNIHIYNSNYDDFIDVNIEWSTTEYNGHVMCPEFFNDMEDPQWHCWDSYGYDVVCEN